MDIASPNTEEVMVARWFVMRAYKSEKRAEEKLKGKEGLSRSKIEAPCSGHSESRIRTCQPHTDHRFQETLQFPAIRDVGEQYRFGISRCSG